jgi:autotransporter-associated beta strand protein
MTNWTRGILAGLVILAGSLVGREVNAQATAVTVSGTTYSQNFDGITTGQTSSIADAAPGWSFFRSGTSSVQPNYTLSGSNTTAVTQNAGTVGTGVVTNSSSGGAYLWVTGTLASGTDKSIGYLSTGSYPGTSSAAPGQSLAILFGFTNTTGATITNLDLGWNYERFRQGTRTQSWEFYTSTDGSTWSANTLGNSALYTGTATNVVYNPPESTATAVSIPSLSIANGSSYYLRWSFVTTGSWTNSQGLGLDDFTMNLTTSGSVVSNDLYWDGGAGWASTSPGAGGTGSWADGSGTWDASKKANFGGTAGTVTVGTVTASNGLAFTTSGYTLTGGTISLAAASIGLNTINTGTDTSSTTTIDSVLAGTAGVMRMGQGTLVLGGANTFTGGLTLSSGTLQIASDANLGDAAGPVSLNGTLKTTADVSLGSGRAISGAAVLNIAPATTLTSSGSFGMSSVTLANSGTLDLQGATRSVGSLTFGTAATVNGSGAISASGLTATGVTSGTAVVNPAITFTSGDKTVDVGSGGTLALNGDIAGTTGRIAKTGAGTLIMSGSNSTSGYRLGVSGASPTNGGTLILNAAAASGTGQLQLNFGTLQSTAPFTFANGLSVGGRTGAVAVLGGTNAMTFSGSTSFFRGTATSGELRLDVNNATSLNGVVGATSGGGTATGITIGGTGSLTINGNASALADAITIQDLLDFTVNGSLGSGTSSLVAQAGTLLGGSGTINGAVTMANGSILAPGTSPGTLTIASALNLNDATNLLFELSATDQTVGGGINDLITGITNLTLDGVLNVVAIGDFSTVSAGAKWRLFNYSGTLTDQLLALGSMPTLAAGNTFAIDVATPGEVSLVVVPEPTAVALGCTGAVLAGLAAWKRRRRA